MVPDDDPIIYQDSDADDTESEYTYESGSEYASDHRSSIPATELEDNSASESEYTSGNDSECAPDGDAELALDTEMEDAYDSEIEDASESEESGAEGSGAGTEADEDTDMEPDEDGEEHVVILPNVYAGWPTNITCRKYAEFIEDYAGRISPNTDHQLIRDNWADFDEHLVDMRRQSRLKVISDMQSALIEGVNDYCDGGLRAQANVNTFVTRASLQGELCGCLSSQRRRMLETWFPEEAEDCRCRAAEMLIIVRERLRGSNGELTVYDIPEADTVFLDAGSAAIAITGLWASMIDVFTERSFARWIRDRPNAVGRPLPAVICFRGRFWSR